MDTQSRDDLEAAHNALSRDPAFQLSLPQVEAAPPPPVSKPLPAWLEAIADVLGLLANVLGYVFWIAVILAIGFIVFSVGRAFYDRRAAIAAMLQSKKTAEDTLKDVDFRPEENIAKNYLEEADALAAQGKFGEAIRLLLRSAIGDIQNHIQTRIGIALTAREIGQLGKIPDISRAALHRIIAAVEQSVFAERSATAEDFDVARKDYQTFAFAEAKS